MKKHSHKEKQRGFTLLLAALVASIVLAVGAAIFGIAQKQITLSAIGRDSQFAFYAADTAAECALYWDFRCNYFATSSSAISSSCNNPNPVCDGKSMGQSTLEAGRPTQPTPPYSYTMNSSKMDLFTDLDPFIGFCAEVRVTKCQGTFNTDGTCVVGAANVPIKTIIHADRYSTNCNSILTNARALQRSVELHY